MASQQNSGAPRLQDYLDLCLHLFKRTPLRKQEALKAHLQRYHKVPRQDWLQEFSSTIGSSTLKALNALAQGGAEAAAAAAAPLGSLPAQSHQDNSQEAAGVSGALSDLLHAGMTAMQARAAQRRCIPASPDNGPRSACMKAEPGALQSCAAGAGPLETPMSSVPNSARQPMRPTRGVHKRRRKVAGRFSLRR